MGNQERYNQDFLKQTLSAGLETEQKSITGFFIRNYRFSYLLFFAILILGIFSLFSLPREADPEVKIPIAVVTTIYPGATPADSEELLTRKVEEKIKNLDGLRRYTSQSGLGFSSITVEFEPEADLKDSYQKLRDAVDEAKPDLPAEAEDPVITEIRVSDMPIVTYSLICQRTPDAVDCELEKYTGLIQTELENISGVSKTEIIGEQEREFSVVAEQAKLANFKISPGQIVSAISRANINLPVGDIEIDGFKYNVRVKGKFQEVDALKNIVVATYENSPVYIKDIAEVIDGHKERKTESRIGLPGQAASESISFQVYKKTGGNIIEIVNQSDDTMNVLKDKKLPASISIIKTNDNSWFIKDTLNTLGMSGLQTMILIIILLFIVLGLRGAIITGISVPIAFLMAFIFLYLNGQTLNSIVLYSLVISLGLMVDNSIIIMEGINEYITRHHKSPLEAALLSVWNFKWPITAGTLTTVSAFLPMLLVSGILGEYFSFIPKTISATLLSSLFVALVIIPTFSSKFIKNGNSEKRDGALKHPKFIKIGSQYHITARLIDKIKIKYKQLMQNILPFKKRRITAIIIAWLLFAIAATVPAAGLMKVEMFPPIDFDTFWVTVEMPAGTTLNKTKEKVADVEKIIAQIPELKSYVSNLGTLFSFGFGGGSSGTHLATIAVNIVPAQERGRKSYEIAARYRPQLEAIQGAAVKLEEGTAGPPTGAPIEARIFGPDTQIITALAGEIKTILENIPGTFNIKDSVEDSTGEFTLLIDKQQANYYSLDTVSIASSLRNAVYGAKASTVTINGDDIDITVKYDKVQFTDINSVENILIFNPRGESIPLKQIAGISLEPSFLTINHRDGEKVISVAADKEEDADLQTILSVFNGKLNGIKLPDGYRIEVGGEVEDIEQSYRETFMSMIVAVILIAFILVLQFNSFRQPFIILMSLPLAIIGVTFGLNILRMPFSFPAFLGIVSLAGIGVNDAIVLIDRVNKNRQLGMKMIESLLEAGQARMQPIFLTSITTIAGIFPLLWASELWRPFSITIIFGLTFSTMLTLVMVPILYASIAKRF